MNTNNSHPNPQNQQNKSLKTLIYGLLLLIFLSFGISGFLFYQNYQLKQQLSLSQKPSPIIIPSPKPTQKPISSVSPQPTITTKPNLPKDKSLKKQVCPEAWYINQMPRVVGETSSWPEYLSINGQRVEIKDYDLDWIKNNCPVNQPEIVQ